MKKNVFKVMVFFSTAIFAISPTPIPVVTPTPTPSVVELTCDSKNITTKAFDIVKETTQREIMSLDIHAKVSTSQIGLNRHSTSLVNEDGEYVDYIEKEDEGRWAIFRNTGMIYFTPTEDFNGTSSVKYVINNNCDYPAGLSNVATVTAKINAVSRVLPVVDGVCMFAEDGEVHADKVIMYRGEKLKVINVFDNDDNGLEDASKFVNASLRLVAPNQDIVRRVHIKNEGTWLANTNTGQVFFVPDDNFIGEAHMNYSVDSPCSYFSSQYLSTAGTHVRRYNTQITIIGPTPTPTPTLTPTPTSTSTPLPTPVVTPTTMPVADTQISQTQVPASDMIEEKIETDSSSALGRLSQLLLMIFTLGIGFVYIRKEK